MIRYLLKFVPERKFAQDLIDGKLFMRPAEYFQKLETMYGPGQGDIGEAATSHDFCMYSHGRVPIYCLFAATEKNMDKSGNILVPVKCIKDFKCENGYAVICEFQAFEKRLCDVDTHGYELYAGMVNYHRITYEDLAKLVRDVIDENIRNIFIKRPGFHYQSEFRIAICKQVPHGDDSIEYWFRHDLSKIAHIVDIASIPVMGDNYVISI